MGNWEERAVPGGGGRVGIMLQKKGSHEDRIGEREKKGPC